MQCASLTKQGKRCRKQAVEGAKYCNLHAPEGEAADVAPQASAHPRTHANASDAASSHGPADQDPLQDDPLHAVAAAMFQAAEAAHLEPTSARGQRPARGVISRAAFSTAYCLGYGIGFPSYLLLGLLPQGGSLESGLREGMEAAKKSAEGLTGRQRKD